MFGRKKQQANALPADTVSRMEEFGQFEMNPMDSPLDGLYVWEHLQKPYQERSGEQGGLISALAAVVVPSGGWAAYGAHRTIASLIGPELSHPDYDEIRRVALRFLRLEGYGPDHLNDYELRFWLDDTGKPYPEE